MDLHLLNRTFVITGSTRGIGLAIARAFLREGANVLLIARNQDTLNTIYHQLSSDFPASTIYQFQADCSQKRDVLRAKEYLLQYVDNIDGLVCNVGSGKGSPEIFPSESEWTALWSKNFLSSLYSSEVFLADLQASHGVITYISSIASSPGIECPMAYKLAKSSLNTFAKTLARRVSPSVRVNVVSPGNIYSPGGVWDVKLAKDPLSVNQMLAMHVPMNRLGTTEEVADVVLFLSSQRASFITGSIINVDGGQVSSTQN